MSDYVPTTGHVQDAYCHVQQGVMGERGDAAHEKFHVEFDRWLAEVQANAWDEGFKNSVRTNFHDRMPRLADNPYRKGQNNE